jgi:polysaccharide export outer membrane protein
VPINHDFRQAACGPVLTAAAPRVSAWLPLVLLLVALAALTGCAGTRGGKIPYNVQNFQAPDSPGAGSVEEDYRIAPLDKIKVSVFQVPDLSGDFEVDLMGNLSLPLIGNVKAVSLTAAELDQKITQMLAARYMQKPEVNVAITSSSTRVVTVDGAVTSPGVIPVGGRLSLIQVIALAKGTTPDANPHRVAVFRQIEGKRMAAAFDLASIRRGEAEDPRIFSGDIVVVDGSQVKSIFSTVLQSLPLLSVFRPF